MTTRTSSRRHGAPARRTAVLPALSTASGQGPVPIVEDTLRALQVVWFAAALEYAPLFTVVDCLVELNHAGKLPVRKGSASALLYEYWQERDERLSAVERSRLYARALGISGASAAGVVPNRALPERWLALVSEVHALAPVASRVPLIERPEVRAAARALAANLAQFGAGTARAAAALHEHIQQALALLADPDVRSGYGARDVWQLVDRIAAQHLGGARNAARYRTLANSGSTIIGWLARHTGALSGASAAPGVPRPYPTDAELIAAVEAWLGASAADDDD